MNTNQICTILANDRVDVTITTYLYSGPSELWRCTLTKREEGVELSIAHSAADVDTAVIGAYEKYQRVVNKGIPEFAGPLLEAPRADYFHSEIDDEIPF